MWATAGNTKHFLEDTFNWLRDAERCNKNKVSSRWHAFFESTTCPTHEALGFPLVKAQESDWFTTLPIGARGAGT
eukprot:8959940-Alexandrium_andersonii.AAC.1